MKELIEVSIYCHVCCMNIGRLEEQAATSQTEGRQLGAAIASAFAEHRNTELRRAQ